MEKNNISITRELDLCISCEICSEVCPVSAIKMNETYGQYLPEFDTKKCIKCGLCLELCPGIDIDPDKLRFKNITKNLFDGNFIENYSGYSNNMIIRKNSSSGGFITTLIIELIKNKEYDYAYVLNFNNIYGEPAQIEGTENLDEILTAAKSKYIPVSLKKIINELKRKDKKSYIIVATPCQIQGIKKTMNKLNISEENFLFLGLFCDKTLNSNIIKFFEKKFKQSKEHLIKFEFRTKEKHGWPGDSKLYFDSKREVIVHKGLRMQLKKYFQLNRCLFCVDKLNRHADISFGDCYIKGKECYYGKSNIIIRTKKGKNIFEKYKHLFTIEKENIESIRESQKLSEKKDNLEFCKYLIKKENIYDYPEFPYQIRNKTEKKLLNLQKNITLGKNNKYNKIKLSMKISKIKNQLNYLGKATIIAMGLCFIIMKGFFSCRNLKKRNMLNKSSTGNIVIVGGELYNKGAQAMTFTVVDQMKRKYPNKNIYLFSALDHKREGTDIYSFNILPWHLDIKIYLLVPWIKKFFAYYNEYDSTLKEIDNIINNADCIIDISGYALSSQWGFFSSINYLLNIIISKNYLKPFYIFPQSISPFNYSTIGKMLLYPLMFVYLKYPKKIFTREKEGLESVYKFTNQNIELSPDIVLHNKEYDLNNIYKKKITLNEVIIKKNSVGIIPNKRVIERSDSEKIYSMYISLINELLIKNKTIYILRHSYEDLEVCEYIKNFFIDNKNVILISNDFNAFELENVIKNFDFLIASRYHSIIHSYKNGVPALVIGWANKYYELLKNFNQLDYFFDIRNNINADEIINSLNIMIKNREHEVNNIKNKIDSIAKNNIFQVF
jgi:coenzyme F420-reducing hydrogenase beta subunit/polysaccharide pyruvyl transferase WcaK-like protein